MDIQQKIEIENGNITLTNQANLDGVLQDNYEERKVSGKGFTQEKTMRKVCSIPVWMFVTEPLLRDYRAALPTDENLARTYLRKWLSQHPEYKTNSGSI